MASFVEAVLKVQLLVVIVDYWRATLPFIRDVTSTIGFDLIRTCSDSYFYITDC
jgi:hypothetical protein